MWLLSNWLASGSVRMVVAGRDTATAGSHNKCSTHTPYNNPNTAIIVVKRGFFTDKSKGKDDAVDV